MGDLEPNTIITTHTTSISTASATTSSHTVAMRAQEGATMARDRAMATMAMQHLAQLYQRASRTLMDITKVELREKRIQRPEDKLESGGLSLRKTSIMVCHLVRSMMQ